MNNPECVKFCNEGVRVTANKLADAYYSAKQLVESYDATRLGDKFGDDPDYSVVVEDGSEADGRPRITVGGVKLTIENIKALLSQLVTTKTPSGLSLVEGILSIAPHYGNR